MWWSAPSPRSQHEASENRAHAVSQGLCPMPWLIDGTPSRSALRVPWLALGVLVELILSSVASRSNRSLPDTHSSRLLAVRSPASHTRDSSCHYGSPP